MNPFTVIYIDAFDSLHNWQYFQCCAEDIEHAHEQCKNAYPECVVIWVSRGHGERLEVPV